MQALGCCESAGAVSQGRVAPLVPGCPRGPGHAGCEGGGPQGSAPRGLHPRDVHPSSAPCSRGGTAGMKGLLSSRSTALTSPLLLMNSQPCPRSPARGSQFGYWACWLGCGSHRGLARPCLGVSAPWASCCWAPSAPRWVSAWALCPRVSQLRGVWISCVLGHHVSGCHASGNFASLDCVPLSVWPPRVLCLWVPSCLDVTALGASGWFWVPLGAFGCLWVALGASGCLWVPCVLAYDACQGAGPCAGAIVLQFPLLAGCSPARCQAVVLSALLVRCLRCAQLWGHGPGAPAVPHITKTWGLGKGKYRKMILFYFKEKKKPHTHTTICFLYSLNPEMTHASLLKINLMAAAASSG